MIYMTFKQWVKGRFLETGEPRKKAYSQAELDLVEMGWNYGYDAGVEWQREKVAQWMIDRGYATGHGDAIADLLKELEWQIREREREACAKVCDNRITNEAGMQREDYENRQCAAAIRARGQE